MRFFISLAGRPLQLQHLLLDFAQLVLQLGIV